MTENEYFEMEMSKDKGMPFASVGDIVEILISAPKELESGLKHQCELGDWPNCINDSPVTKEEMRH
jgi:hypothetical protein